MRREEEDQVKVGMKADRYIDEELKVRKSVVSLSGWWNLCKLYIFVKGGLFVFWSNKYIYDP